MTLQPTTPPHETVLPPRTSDRLFRTVDVSAEVDRARTTARTFVDDVLAQAEYRINTTPESLEAFPRPEFRAMADVGMFRIPFTEEYGGVGASHCAESTVAVIEELAYSSNSVAAIYDVHCILAGRSLMTGGGPIADQVLPELISGRTVFSFATSEPATSSDLNPTAMNVTAETDPTGWVLNGTKRWITNSPVAGWIVVLARTGDRATMFCVDTRLPGVHVGQPDLKLGNHAQLTADVTFTDVRLTKDHLVGQVGQGLRIALDALTYGRIGIGSAGVGMAQRSFDEAVARLRTRVVFGRPLAAFQHWQFTFARHATSIEAARSLCIKAARRLDAGERPEPEAAMAKVLGSTAAVDVVRDAIQVFGGYGFSREVRGEGRRYPLEAIYRDSKIGEIYEGANEIQQWLIAREIFGRDLVG